MKGFLHRLVSETVRPQVRLHPLIEPMYASRVQDVPTAMPVELEVSENTSSLRQIVARRADDAISSSEAAGRGLAAQESLRLKPAMSGFEPLVSEKIVAASEERRSVGEGAATTASNASVSKISDYEAPMDGEVSQLTTEYLPLIIERLTQGPSRDAGEAADGGVQSAHENRVQAPRAVRGAAQIPVRDKAAQVTPRDEVQIHIGRIEVIATPPPAPRTAPAPARKSMSLDDYLNRRDGRVG